MGNKQIIGRVERIWFPELLPKDHNGVLAKIDTGADSGALHCTYVKLSEDKRYLEYQALDENHEVVKTAEFKRVRTKSSIGEVQRRFRVQSKVIINNQEYPIEITLTDRTDMKYEAILGWRFLKDKFLVDVSRTIEPQ